MSEQLYQLHAQIAPHAGLIVALALIASAGLLYWMIVGPAQSSLPEFDYGTEFRDEGFGATSNLAPEDYVPSFDAAMPAATDAESSDERWAELPLPSPDESPEPLALPVPEALPLQPLPPTESTLYPTTSHPNKLDFSRVGSVLPSESDAESSPEVAKRPTESLQR